MFRAGSGVPRILGLAGLVFFLCASPSRAQNLDAGQLSASDTAAGRPLEAPINRRSTEDKFWWSKAWFKNGQIRSPVNHDVVQREVTYTNNADETDIPAILFMPKDAAAGSRKYPGILFQHGRRGLDQWTKRIALRMAARGFVVLAPDVYTARFIDKYPLKHMAETEGDVDAGVDFLLAQKQVSTSRICLYSHTRGGYYTLRSAVTFGRQKKHAACYVSSYPHWNDPNKPEPVQVYRYAPEVDKLTLPTLIFIGEYEQYQRRRSIEVAVMQMKLAKRDVTLIVYPGVGRGFDFRAPTVRTFADDLATKDAVQRAARFFRRHLAPFEKKQRAISTRSRQN